jgi:hypothetical protein
MKLSDFKNLCASNQASCENLVVMLYRLKSDSLRMGCMSLWLCVCGTIMCMLTELPIWLRAIYYLASNGLAWLALVCFCLARRNVKQIKAAEDAIKEYKRLGATNNFKVIESANDQINAALDDLKQLTP